MLRPRRRLTALVAVAGILGLGAWWLARPETAPPEGETAHLLCDEAVGATASRLSDPALREVSGLVASRDDDVLWVHNDSGDGPRVYAIDHSGALLASFEVQGAEASDWEDIALGPGRRRGHDDLYVGDIGDNRKVRDTVAVYRFEEPILDREAPASPLLVAGPAERLELRYPDGPHDAETLLVDPRSGDLFVVTKEATGRSGVYRAPAPLTPGSVAGLERVATLDLGLGGLATGGDVSPEGDAIAVRTYLSVLVWGRAPGEGVGDALGRRPCAGPLTPEVQGEAVGFAPDGESYFTTSEGEGSRVHRWSPVARSRAGGSTRPLPSRSRAAVRRLGFDGSRPLH